MNFAYVQLLSKPYENEVTLTGQNPPLKYCQHLEIPYTVSESVDLLMHKNFGSVGQRAATLLAVKVVVLKIKSAASAIPPKMSARGFGPGSRAPEVKSFSKFDSQQL